MDTRLDSMRLCAAARKSTDLSDFGDPPIEPALAALVESLNEEADLHRIGRALMKIHLRDLLETRLRLVDQWRRGSSAARRVESPAPIFIMGMPRSGSTFLHELLAADPENRAPKVWEVMCPVSCEQPRSCFDRRILKTEMNLWWFRRLAPGADSVYPMRARTPHECVAIHSYTLHSQEFISSCRVPAYERFLRACDLKSVYEWERQFLNHLQDGNKPLRWVLKSPDHVYGLEALFSVFPDALVVQTHRDPMEVLKSSVRLTEVLQRLYAHPADPQTLAEREAMLLAGAMERFINFRDAHPELSARFIDVSYADLINNPVGEVGRVHEFFHIPFTEAAEARIQAEASRRTRYTGRSGTFVLSAEGRNLWDHAHRFKRYCSRYGVSCQQQPV